MTVLDSDGNYAEDNKTGDMIIIQVSCSPDLIKLFQEFADEITIIKGTDDRLRYNSVNLGIYNNVLSKKDKENE
jgi:hypothetical protein